MSQLTDPLARVTIVTGTEIRGQKGGEVSEHIGYLHIRILIRSLHHYTTQFSMLAHTIPHTGYTMIIHYYKLLHIERVKKNLHIPLVFTRCCKKGLLPKSVHEFSQLESNNKL